VRVLLDENLPVDFAALVVGHEVITVRGLGWAGTQNGELMRRAVAVCDVFVTMDRNIPHQQHIPGLPFGVILVTAHSNRLADVRDHVDAVLAAIPLAKPGVLQRVGA
jgi:predicted nuclease of predicted toxin-antitoxin system